MKNTLLWIAFSYFIFLNIVKLLFLGLTKYPRTMTRSRIEDVIDISLNTICIILILIAFYIGGSK